MENCPFDLTLTNWFKGIALNPLYTDKTKIHFDNKRVLLEVAIDIDRYNTMTTAEHKELAGFVYDLLDWIDIHYDEYSGLYPLDAFRYFTVSIHINPC
jgi:methionyl-tRNA synthetase